ncbi:MATE family efflux transporter [Flavitalea sp. BT771]|uniref:MATE family efflux transporter n=1 Tax=Flavitalea sp. BT771 TaxID=3063329 RepID=UPI0026E1B6E7|nr:MATE family efflux transporter [Flavitalea sp. BT771]MDO6433434.1 MATE family efflux transporter [Flavitalea sp. BT771]MDV6222661.1 MATE family efflux transporter [Flavitalea sp. BT771]
MSSDQTTSGSNNSVYSVIKQALSGEHRDYTTGSIRRAVIFLSIPMILEMCMESVFAVVDIFFVGRIGKEAVATVGLTESVLTLVYSMAMGLSMAATAMVARRTGEKNPEGAAHAAAQAINLALGVTVVVSLAGFLLAPDILRLMGGSPETVANGAIYTRIMFGGSVVIMLLYLINGIFRGAGNASMAMWSLWLANGFNILLCPLLIHYFGLKGAAIATTVGRGIGVIYQLYHLFRGKGIIRISARSFKPDLPLLKAIAKVAWTGTTQFLIQSGSWIVLVWIVAHVAISKDAAIAGYQVAIRIFIFFLLPAWGMSNAAATLVGQNLGAQRPDRAEQSVWTAARYNGIFMFIVTLLFLFGSDAIVSFMNKDPEVQKVAVLALRVVSLGYIIYGVGMVLTNAFNGAGDTRTPTLINIFCFWAFQIPLAYILAMALHLGPLGVFIAIPVTELAVIISSYLIFRKGNWKKVKI